MRKFFALFLSATMIFSLTACKGKASEHQDSSIQATGEYIYVPEFYTYDEAVFNILIQETDPYFAGQKSMDEVISIIQNRVKLYVNESR